MPKRGLAHADRAIVVGAMVVSAVLCLEHLGSKSLTHDEGVTAYAATGPSAAFFDQIAREPNFAAYYCILRAVAVVASSEAALRAFSVLCAVLLVPVVFRVATRLFDTRTGITAAVLCAVSGFIVGYAHEARSYTACTLASTVAVLCLLRALDTGSLAQWWLWLASCAVTLVMQPVAAPVLIAHAILLFARREELHWPRLRGVALAGAGFLLAYAALLVWSGSERVGWIPSTSAEEIRLALRYMAGGSSRGLWLLYAIGVVSALVLVRRLSVTILFVVAWIATPVAVLLIVSVVQPLFVARYLIVAAPPLTILAAAGFARLRTPIAIVLTLATVVLGARAARLVDTTSEENWRGAAEVVSANASDGDVVVVAHGNPGAMRYYRARTDGTLRDLELITARDLNRRRATAGSACEPADLWVVTRLSPDLSPDANLDGYRLVTGLELSRLKVEHFRPSC